MYELHVMVLGPPAAKTPNYRCVLKNTLKKLILPQMKAHMVIKGYTGEG